MKAGQLINGYRLSCDGTTANGGRCVWAFGTKDGEEFFIKQFLSPKYPIPGEAPGSEKRKRKLKEKCECFEQQQNRFMIELKKRAHAGSNLTAPVEFIRVGSFYYKIAPKIDVSSVDIKNIAKLPLENKLSIAKTAAHCVQALHDIGIAHGDLKPNNILIKKTETGEFVAKLIDFDDSFFEGEITENPTEVVGDFVYYSPELLRYMKNGGDELRAKVTCRSDIFALGIIYYQYFYGQLPAFNKSKYKYLAVAVLDGKSPGLGRLRLKNRKITKLIERMLSLNPSDRPSAMEIVDELGRVDRDGLDRFAGWLKRPVVTFTGWLKRPLITFAGWLNGTLVAFAGWLKGPLVALGGWLKRPLVAFGGWLKEPLVAFGGWLKGALVAFSGWLKRTLVAKTKAPPLPEFLDRISGNGTRSTASKSLKGRLIAKQKRSV